MFRTDSIKFVLVILFIGFTRSAISAQAESTPCSLSPHPSTGQWAHVISGDANNLRAEPGLQAARIGRIPAGDIFRVLDGPRCADNYVWWQVNYVGAVGWTAEGSRDNQDYWLAALPSAAENNVQEDIVGCEKPPESYDRLQISESTLNLRTLAMLDHAQEVYQAAGGILRFRDVIMQGSYNPGAVNASFGTHDGGGAVDLSARDPLTGDVLAREIPMMIRALRVAGFAAWLRDVGELYRGSPIHIHAIAIGDAELSEAARGQIDGTFGYLRGYNGLPQESGTPLPDTSGEMVVCNWMAELGFHDLRQPAALPHP
jgi:SH3 domain-containing protein